MTVVDEVIPDFEEVADWVSILVLVDDGRRPVLDHAELVREEVFQSLFLWMTVVDVGSHQPPEPTPAGFNPCSCG